MKKMFAPLAPLKRVRPVRKYLVAVLWLTAVVLVLTFAVWRGLLPNPLQYLPGAATLSPETAESTKDAEAAPLLPGDADVPAAENNAENEITQGLTLPDAPMSWPLEGTVLAGHHAVYRIGNVLRAHTGIDIEADRGAEVGAAWPGIVDKVDKDPRLGWVVEIRHGGDYLTQYGNLEEPALAVGDAIGQGEVVGRVGASAKLDAATGYFLHFAVYRGAEPLDPVQVISPR
jgi:murein DD-endopeptidase MepM/ murein hydrolase activator NlpD